MPSERGSQGKAFQQAQVGVEATAKRPRCQHSPYVIPVDAGDEDLPLVVVDEEAPNHLGPPARKETQPPKAAAKPAAKTASKAAASKVSTKAVAKRPTKAKGKGKKKKVQTKFTIDCTHPVEDGIMKVAEFETYLRERIKYNGKTNNLSNLIIVDKDKSKVFVTAEVPFSKRQVLLYQGRQTP
ncbi:hypothetical protein HPB48_019491 [Haemaphysalis longicornis]|uniref:Large ribosomal subunit protein eL22 n=1 Tax=Haemaphysalis longicornis TaxID=44386 RepID=A0A9J6GNZ9_HAELO|nr:hypothetical protein HPB48_019491 [Haemaphysalis longicornis]